jgi:hypothetical protein
MIGYGIFSEEREDNIKTKTPFFGKLPIDVPSVFDWNNYMHLMDSHPEELYDRNTKKMRLGLNSFHSRPSAPEFAKEIVSEMEYFFSLHEGKITNIAFSGFGRESDSYPWHKDSMDVFLCQAISTIGLRVEGVNNDEAFPFTAGDYVWLPRGTHHQIIPKDSRVTFSFGVEGDPDPSMYF